MTKYIAHCFYIPEPEFGGGHDILSNAKDITEIFYTQQDIDNFKLRLPQFAHNIVYRTKESK